MAITLAIAEGNSPHLLIILQHLLQSSDAHVRLGVPVESVNDHVSLWSRWGYPWVEASPNWALPLPNVGSQCRSLTNNKRTIANKYVQEKRLWVNREHSPRERDLPTALLTSSLANNSRHNLALSRTPCHDSLWSLKRQPGHLKCRTK